MTPPSRRLKPMPPPLPPPPPDNPSASTLFTAGGGTVGSKIDQPCVWHRAQFNSKRICPSLTLARRFFHSSDQLTACCAVSTLPLEVRKSPHATASSSSGPWSGTFDASAFARISLHCFVSTASDAPGSLSFVCTALRFVARSAFAEASA